MRVNTECGDSLTPKDVCLSILQAHRGLEVVNFNEQISQAAAGCSNQKDKAQVYCCT